MLILINFDDYRRRLDAEYIDFERNLSAFSEALAALLTDD